MKHRRLVYVGIAVVSAAAIFAGAFVLGSVMTQKDVGTTANVVISGELTVTPASIAFGDVLRGQVIDKEITITNTSTKESLIITASDNLTGLASVDWSAVGTTLAPGASITDNVTFTINLDAVHGAHNPTWTVYGAAVD